MIKIRPQSTDQNLVRIDSFYLILKFIYSINRASFERLRFILPFHH